MKRSTPRGLLRQASEVAVGGHVVRRPSDARQTPVRRSSDTYYLQGNQDRELKEFMVIDLL